MPIVDDLADLFAEATAWRRDLHAHPELLYDLPRTASVVARIGYFLILFLPLPEAPEAVPMT